MKLVVFFRTTRPPYNFWWSGVVRFALIGVCYISEEHARLSGPSHHRDTFREGTIFSFLCMCALSLLWPERSQAKTTWLENCRRSLRQDLYVCVRILKKGPFFWNHYLDSQQYAMHVTSTLYVDHVQQASLCLLKNCTKLVTFSKVTDLFRTSKVCTLYVPRWNARFSAQDSPLFKTVF